MCNICTFNHLIRVQPTQGKNTEIYTTRTFIVAYALNITSLNLRDSRVRTALQQTPFSTCLLAHRVYINECIQILFKHCFNSIQIYPKILICLQRSVQLPHHSQIPIVGFALQRYKLFFIYARESKKNSLTIVRLPTAFAEKDTVYENHRLCVLANEWQ